MPNINAITDLIYFWRMISLVHKNIWYMYIYCIFTLLRTKASIWLFLRLMRPGTCFMEEFASVWCPRAPWHTIKFETEITQYDIFKFKKTTSDIRAVVPRFYHCLYTKAYNHYSFLWNSICGIYSISEFVSFRVQLLKRKFLVKKKFSQIEEISKICDL